MTSHRNGHLGRSTSTAGWRAMTSRRAHEVSILLGSIAHVLVAPANVGSHDLTDHAVVTAAASERKTWEINGPQVDLAGSDVGNTGCLPQNPHLPSSGT